MIDFRDKKLYASKKGAKSLSEIKENAKVDQNSFIRHCEKTLDHLAKDGKTAVELMSNALELLVSGQLAFRYAFCELLETKEEIEKLKIFIDEYCKKELEK